MTTTPTPTSTSSSTRCVHDMVAAWCAVCRGTDRPNIALLDEFGHSLGTASGIRPGSQAAPQWSRRAGASRCQSCGELLTAGDATWSPDAACVVGECCAGNA